MSTKRNTNSRSGRTLGQTILAGVISVPMMETILTEAMPFLNDGNWYAAGIAGTTAMLAYVLSVLQNWLENKSPARRDAPVEN